MPLYFSIKNDLGEATEATLRVCYEAGEWRKIENNHFRVFCLRSALCFFAILLLPGVNMRLMRHWVDNSRKKNMRGASLQ